MVLFGIGGLCEYKKSYRRIHFNRMRHLGSTGSRGTVQRWAVHGVL